MLDRQIDRQTDRKTDRRTPVKQNAPNLFMQGHKNAFSASPTMLSTLSYPEKPIFEMHLFWHFVSANPFNLDRPKTILCGKKVLHCSPESIH